MKRSWPSGLLVLLLIGCGKDLSVPQLSLDQGEGTNVWQAAALGRVEPLKAALAKGSDLNALNQDGWAPLHLAVVANQVAAVKWLLKNGVRINAETAGSRSALDIALTPGFMENEGEQKVRAEITRLLRQHGGQHGRACCGKTE